MFIGKLQNLRPDYDYDAISLITTQTVITNAISTCRTTYMLLNPDLSVNCTYNHFLIYLNTVEEPSNG